MFELLKSLHQPVTAKPETPFTMLSNQLKILKQHCSWSPKIEQKKIDITPTERREHVPLIELVNLGLTDAIIELIENSDENFDINEKDAFGNLAVNLAAQRNDIDMFKLLVEHNAKLDLKDYTRRTPLDWAIKYNNTEMQNIIKTNSNGPNINHNFLCP